MCGVWLESVSNPWKCGTPANLIAIFFTDGEQRLPLILLYI